MVSRIADGRRAKYAIRAILFLFVPACTAFDAPARADYCQAPECRRECWPIPGGTRCRTSCRRRCFSEPVYRLAPPRPQPPRYYPPAEPYHYQPPTEPEYEHAASNPPDPAAALTVLFLIGIFLAWTAGWFDDEHHDHDEDEPDPIELDADEEFDPQQLLADLEARAPEHLSEVEKIEWAAREGQRILSEAARRRR